MINEFSRTELLIGSNGLEKLNKSHVAVFGVGGVGGYAVEMLARSGVGNITIVDFDNISISNKNRQIIATDDTIGKVKVDVMKVQVKELLCCFGYFDVGKFPCSGNIKSLAFLAAFTA